MSVVGRCPPRTVRYIDIRILYETDPFLKSVHWKEVFAIEDVRFKQISLYFYGYFPLKITEAL